MAPGEVEPPAAPAPGQQAGQSGGNFIHGLIGLSPGGFSETVRNSISSLARRDPDVAAALKLDGNSSSDSSGSSPSLPPSPPPPTLARPRAQNLLELPPELLLLILQRLGFADIFRLRKTCKALHHLASPARIRTLFGPDELRTQLLAHCKTCLAYDPFRATLLLPYPTDPGFPLASRCVKCAVQARDPRIRAGRKIKLANFDTVWACRWCGYPIVTGASFSCEQMHRDCFKRFNDILFIYFALGWLQLGLGIVAAALAWRYYRHSVLVFAPTVTNFLLLWICVAFIVLRGRRKRTYHWTLLLELVILGLWIPPVYYIAAGAAKAPGSPVPQSTQATLALFGLNMLFRLVNFVGNVILCSGFDTTEWSREGVPTWRRPLRYLATAVAMWTYPQSLEQHYPSDFW